MMGKGLLAGFVLLLAGIVCLAQAPQSNFPPGTFQSRAALDAGAAAGEGTVLIDLAAISIAGGAGQTNQTFVNGSGGAGGFTLNLGSGPNGTSNRALGAMLIFCGVGSGTTSSSPTLSWNGTSMGSPVGSITSSLTAGAIYFFGTTAPATGSNNFVATWTGANQVVLGILSVVGADQTGGSTTFANLASNSGVTSVSTVSVTAASTRISMGGFSNPAVNYTSAGTGNTDIGVANTCSATATASDYDTGHTNPALAYNPSAAAWVALGVSIKGI